MRGTSHLGVIELKRTLEEMRVVCVRSENSGYRDLYYPSLHTESITLIVDYINDRFSNRK